MVNFSYLTSVTLILLLQWHGLQGEGDVYSVDLSFLSKFETAYFIASEKRTEFFFPKRLDDGSVQHACLILPALSGSEVSCMSAASRSSEQVTSPTEAVKYAAELRGKFHGEWHILYRNAQTGVSSPVIEYVDYWVVAMETAPDLRVRVSMFPLAGSLVPGKMDFRYYVDTKEIPPSLSGSVLDSSYVKFSIQGVTSGLNVPLNLTELSSGENVEPGTWFTTMTPFIHIDTRPADARGDGSSDGSGGLSINGVPLGSTWRIPANNPGTSGSSSRGEPPESADVSRLSGYPSLGYMEFILTPESLLTNRKYSTIGRGYHNPSRVGVSGVRSPPQPVSQQNRLLSPNLLTDYSALYAARQNKPIRVCVWGTLSMDGQKNIFLQQIHYMNQSEFQFTWVVADIRHLEAEGKLGVWEQLQKQQQDAAFAQDQQAAVRSRLLAMPHVKIAASPFGGLVLDMGVLDIAPADGAPPASSVYSGQVGESESALYEWIAGRLRVAEGVFERISPPWVHDLYILMRNHIVDEGCDIIVYGNSRGYSSNVLITDTARVMGVPTVTELLNLFIDPGLVPSAVVGPSVYSIEHEKAMLFVDGDPTKPKEGIRTVVIPPSVDLDRFDPDKIAPQDVIRHPQCAMLPQPCFTVGFIARLSTEKNPGLFLQMAHILLKRDPFIRFTMVGDGDLMPFLRDLAGRLGILWAVDFVGWRAGEDLPRTMKGFDVVVNPSVRAWSETFCIANIEAMSMRIPLVTFAVGGIGEYVQEPEGGPGRTRGNFSVSPNAVVVNECSPHAMAAAVEALKNDPALRTSLGHAGRETVLHYFTVDRQMQQYGALYKEVMATKMQLSGLSHSGLGGRSTEEL